MTPAVAPRGRALAVGRRPGAAPRRAPVAAAAAGGASMPNWDSVQAYLTRAGLSSTPPAEVAAAVAAGKAVVLDVRPRKKSSAATPAGALAVALYDAPDFSRPRCERGRAMGVVVGGGRGRRPTPSPLPSVSMLLKAALLASMGVSPIEMCPTFAADVEAVLATAGAGGKTVFTLCETGGTLSPTVTFATGKSSRSLQAAFKLLEGGKGVGGVGHVDGGLLAWAAAGLPVDGEYDGRDAGRTPGVVR